MRLLTRKPIYRAFPELDGYSDERCRQFVKAANRSWGLRALSWFMQAIVVGTIVVLDVVVLVYFGSNIHDACESIGVSDDGFTLLVLLAFLALPALAALQVRDGYLRDRLKEVLRARASCRECRYSLIGVAVRSGGEVVCPECGTSITVDPSLGELTREQGGRVVYEPSDA